ncbi:hypothetical protein FKW77_004253 [Venturia effusa]|uniref:EthD domain-containing protein n=1 Tax=Venturia effusa TaxID=50376 RepID=A0A517L929_9PEZI|nr:hypothetical protein FKW77_004253 [Venturia effusa]
MAHEKWRTGVQPSTFSSPSHARSILNLHEVDPSNFLRGVVTEVTQFHAPEASKAAIAPLSGAGSPIAVYDGYAEFLVPSVEVFQAAFEDPFYVEEVAPDEEYLFDRGGFALSAGYRQMFWKDDGGGFGV